MGLGAKAVRNNKLDIRHRLARVVATLALGISGIAQASSRPVDAVCHVSYGGETQQIRAIAGTDPYSVHATPIGSYFLFRAVVETQKGGSGSVKLYTYADQEGGQVPIHVAHFPYPLVHAKLAKPARSSPFGFTGEQFVYEPVRDGELHYWCELDHGARKRK
jgi:hypothetical protein